MGDVSCKYHRICPDTAPKPENTRAAEEGGATCPRWEGREKGEDGGNMDGPSRLCAVCGTVAPWHVRFDDWADGRSIADADADADAARSIFTCTFALPHQARATYLPETFPGNRAQLPALIVLIAIIARHLPKDWGNGRHPRYTETDRRTSTATPLHPVSAVSSASLHLPPPPLRTPGGTPPPLALPHVDSSPSRGSSQASSLSPLPHPPSRDPLQLGGDSGGHHHHHHDTGLRMLARWPVRPQATPTHAPASYACLRECVPPLRPHAGWAPWLLHQYLATCGKLWERSSAAQPTAAHRNQSVAANQPRENTRCSF
ncbi:hypothetical protein CPLU01_04617 [Colletotrichum plurivorum]|uniref:Uncharacterized protein n=1 Tax=Colletotrichum plurivorum TaxID=2175906 RepID=A0A8H6KP63_9PEZI|nr:hypothetical protein CPLU01_04617 [Colletotrichum plurivorum]